MRADKLILDKVVGDNIRRERGVRKLSREELAELIDLTVSHLGLIERGERGATPVVLKKLCEVLNVKVDYLLNEQGRAMTARETDGENASPIRNKVNVLTSRLNDTELEILASTAKGILKLRKDPTFTAALFETESE